MTFKKLALATAVACAPMATFAVESLDDATLSATTGQDGIQIELDLAVSTDVLIHDTDGIDAAFQTSHAAAGAIVIENMSIDAQNVVVQVDAGDTGATLNAPVLNVNVDLSSGASIVTGTIAVANSNRDDGTWGAVGMVTVISSATLVIGATQLNVQLGNEPQGAMVRLDATITGGLALNNMSITDAGGVLSGGSIGSASMLLIDTGGGASLTADIDIDVDTTGLVIGINQLGTLAGGMDVRIVDQYLGLPADVIGDVEVQGLNLAGTQITISGK